MLQVLLLLVKYDFQQLACDIGIVNPHYGVVGSMIAEEVDVAIPAE